MSLVLFIIHTHPLLVEKGKTQAIQKAQQSLHQSDPVSPFLLLHLLMHILPPIHPMSSLVDGRQPPESPKSRTRWYPWINTTFSIHFLVLKVRQLTAHLFITARTPSNPTLTVQLLLHLS